MAVSSLATRAVIRVRILAGLPGATDAGRWVSMVTVRPDQDEVNAWLRHWGISASTGEQLQALAVTQGEVPPITGMPAEVVAELQALPLRALGQLRDLFRPDLYPGARPDDVDPQAGPG